MKRLPGGKTRRAFDPMKRFARRTTKKVLGRIGRVAEEIAQHAGQMALLTGRTVVVTLRGRVSVRSVLDQFWAMGVQSLPLVLVTAVISGVVTTQQGGYQLTSTIPLYVLGSVVASSVVLELGPVMTSFVLIGRVGARITAELGTMQVIRADRRPPLAGTRPGGGPRRPADHRRHRSPPRSSSPSPTSSGSSRG